MFHVSSHPFFIISIHAPTRGATVVSFAIFGAVIFQSTLLQEERQAWDCISGRGQRISIHAPTRGATSSSKVGYASENISIHAPTRGATISQSGCRRKSLFQSTLLQEERPYRRADAGGNHYFNPRSYKRSDSDPVSRDV